jgi:hypothetical protein
MDFLLRLQGLSMCAMSSGPKPQKRWDPKDFGFYGALLGLIAGIMRNFYYALRGQIPDVPEDDLLTYLPPEMILFVVAGAALLAAIAAIRNWLMLDR